MKILIIVTNYLDKKQISSKRWRTISKEMVKQGNQVDVIAWDDGTINERKDKFEKIDGISYCKIGECIANEGHMMSKSNEYGRSCRFNLFRLIYYICRTKCVEYRCRRIAKDFISKVKFECCSYDYVICSVQKIDTYYLAEYLKNHNMADRLICDVRDVLSGLIYGKPEQDIIGEIQIKRIAKNADFMMCVNGGIKKWILSIARGYSSERIHIFPHGIDSVEDLSRKDIEKDTLFQIAYTGSAYRGLRKMEPLFAALNLLKNDGKKISFVVAGKNTGEFRQMAESYRVEDMLKDMGMIPRDMALGIQQKSDILFYMTYIEDDSEYCGMSGKFPEYMASGKPIISLINAKAGYSWYKNEIEKYGLGIVVDVNDINAPKIIHDFILYCMQGFRNEININSIKKYTILDIADRINQLLLREKSMCTEDEVWKRN